MVTESNGTAKAPPKEANSFLPPVTPITVGSVGPWAERLIAIFRTLNALGGALDDFEGCPKGIMRDEVAFERIEELVREANKWADELILMTLYHTDKEPDTQGVGMEEGQAPYSPEKAEWSPAFEIKGKTHEFEVLADAGFKIATITVNRWFNIANARKIVRLMSWSPELWRDLQKAAPLTLSDGSPNDEFAHAMDTLWQAAGRFPFAWPNPDEDEESLMDRINATVIEQIKKAGAA